MLMGRYLNARIGLYLEQVEEAALGDAPLAELEQEAVDRGLVVVVCEGLALGITRL